MFVFYRLVYVYGVCFYGAISELPASNNGSLWSEKEEERRGGVVLVESRSFILEIVQGLIDTS